MRTVVAPTEVTTVVEITNNYFCSLIVDKILLSLETVGSWLFHINDTSVITYTVVTDVATSQRKQLAIPDSVYVQKFSTLTGTWFLAVV